MKMALLSALVCAAFTVNGALAETSTAGVRIAKLSLSESGAGMLVQTASRHMLDTGCVNDYWLVLESSAANYEMLVAMLMTAQSRGASTTVYAANNDSDFCKLSRLVIDG